MYFNLDQITASKYLSKIHFPIIISILGESFNYNHGVVVWRQMIIDFENETTNELSVGGIDNIAGVNNRFHKVMRGYEILPSKKIKWAVTDWTDRGKNEMHGELHYLFKKGKWSWYLVCPVGMMR